MTTNWRKRKIHFYKIWRVKRKFKAKQAKGYYAERR